MSNAYDLVILGGGPAGYFAAERGADEGLRILLIEERALGGVCLNEGCIPTKSLLYAAKLMISAKHGADFGFYADNLRLDHAKVIERKNKVVQKLVGGVSATLKQKHVDAIRGKGVIKGRGDGCFIVGADEESYEARRLLICTGSDAVIPPIAGLREAMESGFVITSRECLALESAPERLVIIGGGVIGLELANYFAVAGTRVTVVEMLPEVGGAIDADVAKNLRTNLGKLGVRFLLQAKAEGIVQGGVRIITPAEPEIVPADKVLLSIGRKPRIDGAGLENIGLYTERGAVVTDSRMRTNVPGVWAAGDVNGKSMLAHTAYREAAVSIKDIVGEKDFMNYDAIPQVIYTYPEAAGVGETEQSAAAKGYVFDKAVLPMQYSGRYVAENTDGDGFIKALVSRDTGRILGLHMVGTYASEIILAATILIGSKLTAETASKIVYPHPSVGEILRDVLLELL